MIPGRKILDVHDLSVRREGRIVLEGINLTLNCGDATLLTGPNGCGKTTLIRAIAGFLPVSSGKVSLFGVDAGAREWRKQRHLLSYVPQEELITPFPVSVEELAALGAAGLSLSRKERQDRVEQALMDTGCWEMRDRSYFTLSGGEKRRAALARCLCQGSHLMLLDEPLTYLDRAAKDNFLSVLERIRRDYSITILMVTHSERNLEELGWHRYHFSDSSLVYTRGVVA